MKWGKKGKQNETKWFKKIKKMQKIIKNKIKNESKRKGKLNNHRICLCYLLFWFSIHNKILLRYSKFCELRHFNGLFEIVFSLPSIINHVWTESIPLTCIATQPFKKRLLDWFIHSISYCQREIPSRQSKRTMVF